MVLRLDAWNDRQENMRPSPASGRAS